MNARADALRACAARGLTLAEAAREIGMDYGNAHGMAARAGIVFRPARRGPPLGPRKGERAALIRAGRAAGMKLREIGAALGVTPQAVHETIRRHRLDAGQ